MTGEWRLVLGVGAATAMLKAAGPLLLGGGAGRQFPPRVRALIGRLPPGLFAGLIATQVFGRGHALVVDARTGGLAAAGLGAALRLPPVVTIAAAVAATAVLRHLGL